MKKIILAIAAVSTFFAACNSSSDADKVSATDAQEVMTSGDTLNANIAESNVEWLASKGLGKLEFGKTQHHGTFKLQSGYLLVDSSSAITGGKFIIDIKSLKSDDMTDTGYAHKLDGHLLSPDFFNADTFATASLEITAVAAGVDTVGLLMKDATHTITGNLTLKNVTKSISFPAKVSQANGVITADANFTFDRTQWNLSYGNDKSFKDKFIHPDVTLKIHTVCAK